MNSSVTLTTFSGRDRHGALIFAVRHARDTHTIHVLFFDYLKREWCVERYLEFNKRNSCEWGYQDVRYVLPDGETTRLS